MTGTDEAGKPSADETARSLRIAVDGFTVADTVASWESAGFVVGAGGACRVGGVVISLVGNDRGEGIVGWSLSGLPEGQTHGDIDGVPTWYSAPVISDPPTHLNGVIGVDHVVLLSPDLRRTVDTFAAIGAEPRRERDGELGGRPIRQIFFRFGEVVVEAVGSTDQTGHGPRVGPSTLWGITYVVADIEATASFLGGRTSPVKDAVQPGRRITTLRHREFGMSVRTAVISPRQRRA